MVSTTGFKILLLFVGFVWWSIAFVVLYSVQSVSCGWQWHLDPSVCGVLFLRVLLIGLYVLFCIIGVRICLGFISLSRRRRGANGEEAPAHLLETSCALAAYAAAVATLLTFAPILYASPCT
jgi:hypothetical protein